MCFANKIIISPHAPPLLKEKLRDTVGLKNDYVLRNKNDLIPARAKTVKGQHTLEYFFPKFINKMGIRTFNRSHPTFSRHVLDNINSFNSIFGEKFPAFLLDYNYCRHRDLRWHKKTSLKFLGCFERMENFSEEMWIKLII